MDNGHTLSAHPNKGCLGVYVYQTPGELCKLGSSRQELPLHNCIYTHGRALVMKLLGEAWIAFCLEFCLASMSE